MLAKFGDGQDSASAQRVADAIALAKVNGQGAEAKPAEATFLYVLDLRS